MNIPNEGSFDLRAAAAKITAFDWNRLEALSGHVTKATATFDETGRQLRMLDTALTPALRAGMLTGITELTAARELVSGSAKVRVGSAIADAKAALELIVPDARKPGWFSSHPFTQADRTLRTINLQLGSVLTLAYEPMRQMEQMIAAHYSSRHGEGGLFGSE